MNIVSWNCKGLGNPSKFEVVKDLIRLASPGVLLLQETKIEEDTLLSLSIKNWKKNAGKDMSAQGSFGGLTTLWTEELYWKTHFKHSTVYLLSYGTFQVRSPWLFLIYMYL